MKPSAFIEYQQHLDARQWVCPMPLLKMKLQLAQLPSGQVLYVQASDVGSWQDIPRFIGRTAHQLLQHYQDEQGYHFFIRGA